MAVINGTPQDDVLSGTSDADTINGGAGNDTLIGADSAGGGGGGGNDTLIGGTGGALENDRDKVDYSAATAGITVNMTGDASLGLSTVSGDSSVGTDTLTSIEWVIGSAFDDTYTADTSFVSGPSYEYFATSNRLAGLDALNWFEGGAGNDTVTGNGSTYIVYNNATSGITADLATGKVTGDASVGTDTVSGIGGVKGTAFADVMTGSAANEVFQGGDGADTIDGGGGNDWASYVNDVAGVNINFANGTAVDGWGNNDTLKNIERVIGSAFADTLTGDGASNTFRGLAGNDTINGGGGTDWVSYANDIAGVTVDLSTGTATDGWGDTDTLQNIENVEGSFFDDKIAGTSTGKNIFRGLAGNDTFDGGSGLDVVDYENDIAGVTVDLSAGTATDGWGNTDTLINIESVTGSAFDDNIIGDSNNDSFRLMKGNDTVDGGGGVNLVSYLSDIAGVTADLSTGTATDGWGTTDVLINIQNLDGSNFDDVLTGDLGANLLLGEAGNDTLIGGSGNDTLTGGAGGSFENDRDKADYSAADGGITVHMVGGDAASNASTVTGNGSIGTDTLNSIEWIIGGNFDDTYTADAGFVSGSHYHYSLGNQRLVGSDTINYFQGGLGNDVINGNDNTRIVYSDATSGIDVDLSGEDSGGTGTIIKKDVAGNSYADTVTGIGSVVGSSFNDTIVGSSASETFIGGQGNDTINGNGGNDWASYRNDIAAVTVDLSSFMATDGWGNTDLLFGIERVAGSAFDDTLQGDSSDNWIRGNAGNDTIVGGGGNDYADYVDDVAGVTVDLGAGTATDGWGNTDTLVSIERVRGSFYDDWLTGDASSNVFIGLAGNDTFNGSGGSDWVSYAEDVAGVNVNLGTENSTDGWGNIDTLSSIENVIGSAFNDTLTGSSGNNFIRGEAGNDTLNGAGGSDYADYRDDIAGVNVDLAAGTATDGWGNTDTLSNIENIRGSAFGDVLTGDGNANVLRGLAGADTLNGGGGSDWADYSDDTTANGALAGVTVDLTSGTASDGFGYADTLISIENVDGTSFTDGLVGDNGANQLLGEAGDDVLSGLGGNDTLDGGTGFDRVVYAGQRASYSISRSGGSVTITDVSGLADGIDEGTDTLTRIERLQFSDVTMSLVPPNDFNGDGLSDALWQNSRGYLANWNVDSASQISTPSFLPAPSSDWSLIATADFNADGRADYLWRNSTNGALAQWYVDSTGAITYQPFLPGPSSDWNLLAAADLNGDGRADFLWQNSATRDLAAWFVDDTSSIAYTPSLPGPSADWTVLGTGDFNGDGRADVLWNNSSLNVLAIWTVDFAFNITSSAYISDPTSDWTFKSIADLNGDGKSDLLWQNNVNGALAPWYMNGLTVGTYATELPGPSPDWQLKSLADVNGDGKADYLWQNTTNGALATWQVDPTTSAITTSPVLPGPSSDWALKTALIPGQLLS